MNLRKASLFLFLFSVFFSYAQDNIEISVPFSSGAIGTIGTNTQKNNDVTMFESLDLERAYFSQTVSSTSGIFSAQGNDIPGSLILVFTNDERVVIDGAIIWRTNDESFGFLAKEDVSFNLNEYGSVSKIITGGMDDNTSPPSSNFSLLRNDRSWSYVNTDDISGNAAGVIDDLNLYLGISNSNKPSGPITVNDLITSDTTPIISGTASISTSTERLEIIVNNIVYAWDSSYTSEINYDPTSGEWSIQIAGALNIATYDVDAFIYNADDYFVSDLTSNELQIIAPDTTDPIILDQTFTYAENQAANYAIGTVSATDSNTLTYSIESGTYSSSFAINSSTGAITLTNVGSTSSAPSNDYETDPNSFSLVVRVTDPSSNTATGTITINVTDVDDTDPVILDQTFTYAENQAANYAIGTVSATDNNTLTYSIESGTYSSSFAINSSTGAITLTNVGSTSSAPSNDYETDPNSFSLVVRVTDPSSNTATGTITINVTDVDDTDPVILDQTFTYAESQAANYAIGSVSATDSNTLTYAFETGENPDGFFAINSSTGAITLTSTGSASSAASNDYATTPNSFSLIVKVTDLASNTATGTITINVTEVDNTAPVLADQTFTYAESQAANYAIGTVSATDSNTLTYAFETGENSDGFFAINSSSGAITLTSTGSTSSAASNDYETIPNSFSLIVKVTDPSSNTTTGTITINVTDVSEIIDDDQDGLPNGEELELGTDPFDADTDGDGVLDGTEVTDGTNPLDVCDYVSAHITQVQKEAWLNADCDSDGLTNKEEKDLGTDPKNADTDGDGVLDGTEVTRWYRPFKSV